MTLKEREFQIFVKPVSDFCNLRCSYCYYHLNPEPELRSEKFRMSDDLLETYIKQHIEATTGDLVLFSWHGGEPALAGIDFYRKAVELQKKYLPTGKKLINGIQTNGTLIDVDWCKFLSEEKFLVGISIDGPGKFHDHFRITGTGSSSFKKVIESYGLLKEYGVTTEILCVVNSFNSKYPHEVYSYFKSLNARYITFLPLVELKSADQPAVTERSVHPEVFGNFLIKIFDEWIENDIGRITIQIFEEAFRTAFNQEHTLCIFKENCGGVPVIESNGDFYSCDHFVNKNHLLGNIPDNSVSYFLDCEEQQSFGLAKSMTLPAYCMKCDVKQMCNGECPKNRFTKTPEGESGLNYLCEGYLNFFRHCQPFIEAVKIMARV